MDSMQETIGFTDTGENIIEYSYTFVIKNFHYCLFQNREKIGGLIYQKVIANYRSGYECYLNYHTFLFHQFVFTCEGYNKEEAKCFIYASISVVNASGKDYLIMEGPCTFKNSKYTITIEKDNLKKIKEILCNKVNILPNGQLSLKCKLYFGCKYIKAFIPASKLNSTTITSTIQPREFDKFAKLLENDEFSDFLIRCTEDNTEFRVHKAILALSSPVFLAMFRVDMIEKKLNYVDIKNFNSKVIKEMLKFVYTGQVSDIRILLIDLYMLADQYGIDGLKQICLRELHNNLSVENIVEVLEFAQKCELEHTLKYALNFCIGNAKIIFARDNFSDILKSGSPWVLRLLNIVEEKLSLLK